MSASHAIVADERNANILVSLAGSAGVAKVYQTEVICQYRHSE